MILAIAIFGFGFLNPVMAPSIEESELEIPEGGEVSYTGEGVCLPHANPGDFETLECAFGILVDDKYYAVDLSQEMSAEFQTGVMMTVEGWFVPLELLSNDRWYNYAIEGVIQVSKLELQ